MTNQQERKVVSIKSRSVPGMTYVHQVFLFALEVESYNDYDVAPSIVLAFWDDQCRNVQKKETPVTFTHGEDVLGPRTLYNSHVTVPMSTGLGL